MAGAGSAMKGLKILAEPLICVGLKAVLDVPIEGAVAWLKAHFTDHTQALPKAVAAANQRAWQAVALALAGDTLYERIKGLFRDADIKAVRDQIRIFVANADTGLELFPANIRLQACDELNRLKRDGRLGVEGIALATLDLTRIASPAKIADDARRAISTIADDLLAESPNLARILMLAPPNGGTPLLAAAFAYFLRRNIATDAELSRELTHDQLRLLTLKQHSEFENLERLLSSKSDEVLKAFEMSSSTNSAEHAEMMSKLDKLLEFHQVSKKPGSQDHVTIAVQGERRLPIATSSERVSEAKLVSDEWSHSGKLQPTHAGDTFELLLPNGIAMRFAWCPAGSFFMGSEGEDSFSPERPIHRVTITKGFYAGIYPVTQAEWQAVTGSNPSHFKGPQRPVEKVSWDSAKAFCQMLQRIAGKPIRLPSEAEWEYACRAGQEGDFWNGNVEEAIKLVGWCHENSNKRTQPVGLKRGNPWGLFDVHGNVWEWCEDWYDVTYYQNSPTSDPKGSEHEQTKRVLRGGSWGYMAKYCRASHRFGEVPGRNDRGEYVRGLRVIFNLD